MSSQPPTGEDTAADVLSRISGDQFADWYSERQFTKNIRNGQPYFNGSSPVPPATKHSPSQLLQCHRKKYYQAYNAPKETEDPHGIFWIGEQFETEIAVPFLQSIVEDGQYVRNSMWIDLSIETGQGTLRFRGETDPVIVDSESRPHFVTEIKTTSSLEYMDQPKQHHKAQIHTYMRGLTEEHDTAVDRGVILYGDRDSFEVRAFKISFDQQFWNNEVKDWATRNTGFRQSKVLPPSTPEADWECSFCSYKNRCGQTDHHADDKLPTGLLTLFQYPRSQVEEYLDAHENAKLTPTLAREYPDLAEKYPTHDLKCQVCGNRFEIDDDALEGGSEKISQCPECASQGIDAQLSIDQSTPPAKTGGRN